jgi:hypothetical protein
MSFDTCGHRGSIASMICQHLFHGTTAEWLPLPKTYLYSPEDFLCPECYSLWELDGFIRPIESLVGLLPAVR